MNESLCQQLSGAWSYYQQLDRFAKEVETLRQKETKLKNGFDKRSAETKNTAPLWVLFGVCLWVSGVTITILLFLLIGDWIDSLPKDYTILNDEPASPVVRNIIMLLLTAAGLVMAFIFRHKALVRRKENEVIIAEAKKQYLLSIQPQCGEIEQNIMAITNKANDFRQAHVNDLSFIPSTYRNPICVYYFYTYVQNCRADSLKDAINLYEEECHRARMEDMERQKQQQMNELQDRLNQLQATMNQVAADQNRAANAAERAADTADEMAFRQRWHLD